MIDIADDMTESSQSDASCQRRAERLGGDKTSKPSSSVTATMTVKVRLSTHSKDIKVSVLTTERVKDLKRKLHESHGVDPKRITMLYSGRVLSNSTSLKSLDIPKGYVIQAIVT